MRPRHFTEEYSTVGVQRTDIEDELQ